MSRQAKTWGNRYDVTWPVPLPVLSLDCVWARPQVRLRSCELRWAWRSDHRAVVVTLGYSRSRVGEQIDMRAFTGILLGGILGAVAGSILALPLYGAGAFVGAILTAQAGYVVGAAGKERGWPSWVVAASCFGPSVGALGLGFVLGGTIGSLLAACIGLMVGTAASIVLAGFIEHGLRPGPDHCQRCGYNLTGNVSGACPECGAVVSVPGIED